MIDCKSGIILEDISQFQLYFIYLFIFCYIFTIHIFIFTLFSGNIKKYTAPQTSTLIQHNNKLHILSPISDKSSQEPISETSDNNRNNNSQKCSPEEVAPNQETLKTKRRLPQNKNLLNLANPEIQGSDSGISIQSREGMC